MNLEGSQLQHHRETNPTASEYKSHRYPPLRPIQPLTGPQRNLEENKSECYISRAATEANVLKLMSLHYVKQGMHYASLEQLKVRAGTRSSRLLFGN